MKALCEKLAEQYAEDKSKAYYIDQNGDQKWYITKRGQYSKEDFLAGYKAAQQWISVKDRLPEIGKEILWYHEPGGEFSVGLLHHKVEQPFFTHWMELPEPPKEEK